MHRHSVENGWLQEGEHVREGVVAEGRARGGDRPVLADGQGGRDQDLGTVGHERRLGGRDRGLPEVGERQRSIRPDPQPHPVDLPVCQAQSMEPLGHVPGGSQELAIDVGGVEGVERAGRRLAHEQRITLGGRPGGHHGHDLYTAPLRHEGQERLVLDQLQSAGTEMRRLSTVPEGGPGRRDQLSVPRVTAVDLHQQGSPVRCGRRGEGDPARFERRLPQIGRLHTDLIEGRGDLTQRQATGGGTDQQVHDRGASDPDDEPRQDADREGDAESDTRECPGDDHGSPEEA